MKIIKTYFMKKIIYAFIVLFAFCSCAKDYLLIALV